LNVYALLSGLASNIVGYSKMRKERGDFNGHIINLCVIGMAILA
jgi:hypothetical protein